MYSLIQRVSIRVGSPILAGSPQQKARNSLSSHEINHTTMSPTFNSSTVCGFCNVQLNFETGPTAYRPYPRRLESLTV